MVGNILVIEDSLTQAKEINDILKTNGHNVHISYDGIGITEIMEKNEIDIVLIDIVLPNTDGFILLNEILSNEYSKDLPIIMVTELKDGENVKRALDAGAFDYIKKPIESIELIARVNSSLRFKFKQDELKAFAMLDHLTKLYNRGYLDRTLPSVMQNISAYPKGISVALIDCDWFKRINDSYGHPAGDHVLISVSKTIYKTTKSTDITCRYGGEEFCAVLLNTTYHEGVEICKRIRKNVEKMEFVFDKKKETVTVSIGVSHCRAENKTSVLKLINEADQALYEAKRAGRNKVRSYIKR